VPPLLEAVLAEPPTPPVTRPEVLDGESPPAKRLAVRVEGRSARIWVRKAGARTGFLFAVAGLVALIIWLRASIGSMDDGAVLTTALFVGIPVFAIGAYAVFPGRRVLASEMEGDIEVQRAWLGIAYHRTRVPFAEIDEISPAVVGVAVERRAGVDGASTALGVLSAVTLGVGWVSYDMETETIPAFGILVKRKSGRPLLTHVTWSADDCRRAVDALRAAMGVQPLE